jgi:hypothetical protein
MDFDSENARFDFVRRVQRETRVCIDRVIRESDRLRALLESSEFERKRIERQLEGVVSERDELECEVKRLRESLGAMETEYESTLESYANFESQTTNIANLYVATYRLHGAVDVNEVLGVIEEIVANLIGSEEIAILAIDPADARVSVLRARGLEESLLDSVVLGVGPIGRALALGQTFIRSDDTSTSAATGRGSGERELTACVPLRVCGGVVGALAIFGLLPQKPGLEPIDFELLALLGEQAGVAIYTAAVLAREGQTSIEGRRS